MRSTIAKRYSKGLFDLAQQQGMIEEIAQDCQGIVAIFNDNPELTSFLQNPKIKKNDKKMFLEQAFKDKINQNTYNFIKLLLKKGRIQNLEQAVVGYLVLTDIHKGIIDAQVTSTVKLDSSQADKIKAKLEASTNKKVKIDNIVDPTIIGGLIIKIGNKVIDGSTRNKISKIKESLLKAQVMEIEVRE